MAIPAEERIEVTQLPQLEVATAGDDADAGSVLQWYLEGCAEIGWEEPPVLTDG